MKKIIFLGILILITGSLFAATLKDVQNFVAEGKYEEAITACNDILAQKPGNINALRWICYSNYKLGNYDAVIETSKSVQDSEISNIAGLSYVAKGDLTEAEKAFNDSIVYDKSFMDPYINKAQIYITNKDFTNAKSYLVIANNINSKDLKVLTNLGYVNIELKEYDNAIANLIKAKNINSKDQTVLANLGNAYFLKGDNKNALKEYEALYAIDVNNQNAIVGLANTNAALGNDKEAQKYFDILIKLTDSYNANYNMGILAKRGAKFGDATGYFAKALEVKPDDIDALNELGWCQFKSNKSDESIATLNKVLELSPDNITAISYLGVIYSNLNKPEDAYANWSRCVIIAPKNADYKVNLANSCLELDKFDEAIEAYKSALAINPKVPNANLGLACATLEKALSVEKPNPALISDALNSFKNITQTEPKNVIAWNNLGVCYQKQNKYNEALAAYKKALAINPNFAQAKANFDELSKVMN